MAIEIEHGAATIRSGRGLKKSDHLSRIFDSRQALA
jgi:hypothetical protein